MNNEVTLNKSEAEAVLTLLDLAVKAGGMQVAKAGVIISEKIISQLEPQPVPTELKEAIKEVRKSEESAGIVKPKSNKK